MNYLIYIIILTVVMHFVFRKTIPLLLKDEDKVHKEILYQYDDHAFIYSFAAGLITTLLTVLIISIGISTESYNLIKYELIVVILTYFISCVLIFLRIKSSSEKLVKGREAQAIERSRIAQEKSTENINHIDQGIMMTDDYERLAYEYQQNLHAQIMSSLDEEINHQISYNSVDNSVNENPQYGSTEFVGIDGDFYTKDEYGYLRRKGETEIIGQNGYDNNGKRIEYY